VLFGLAVQHAVTRSVRDSAAVLDATAGGETGAPYAAPPRDRPFLQEVGAPAGSLRIAFTTDTPAGAPCHRECVEAVRQVAALCEDLGHRVDEAAPTFANAHRNIAGEYFKILVSALSASLVRDFEKLVGRPITLDEFEISTRASVEFGRGMSAIDLIDAITATHRLGRIVARFMRDYDVLLAPTLASPPIRLGVLAPNNPNLDEHIENIFNFAAFTPMANVTGQPAISLPLCQSGDNLPIGVQFTGRFADEATLFRLAAQLEDAQPWADRRPQIYG
jgi:amidase